MANGDDSTITTPDSTTGGNSLTVRLPTSSDGFTLSPGGNSLLLPAPTSAPNQLSPSTAKTVSTYASAVGSTEGTGPNRMGSSAAGTGQFMPDTWRSFARANPDMFSGMTDDQILAKRNDPAYGNRAIEWYSRFNSDILKSHNIDVNGYTLRTAHALGGEGAARVLVADDSDPMTKYLSPLAQTENPQWAKMTVGQFKAQYKNTPNPAWMGGPDGTTAVAATSTEPAAGDLPPQSDTNMLNQAAQQGQDAKRQMAMSALTSLLPLGFKFQPINYNPFREALIHNKIPWENESRIRGLPNLTQPTRIEIPTARAAYTPGTIPGFRGVAPSSRDRE